jgi:dihydroxyacid dehydratase/phosphogluconate dehydratase
MEESYQVTAALRHLSFGRHVALLTDARFSGVSTGACVGHISPEALAGGPIGKLQDGDLIAIEIDPGNLKGTIDFLPWRGASSEEGAAVLAARPLNSEVRPDPELPADTRLWAMLQTVSGGPWAGSVYDVDRIAQALAQPLLQEMGSELTKDGGAL